MLRRARRNGSVPLLWLEPPVGDLMALVNAANAGDQRAEGDDPEIDRPALILEMLLHVTFLMLMTYACMSKRIIAEAFYLYQAP